jgi:hypothetical protein
MLDKMKNVCFNRNPLFLSLDRSATFLFVIGIAVTEGGVWNGIIYLSEEHYV